MTKVTTRNGVVHFRTALLQGGKTATGIEVPEAAVTALGSHKRPPVKVTINGGHTYRSTVAVMGGKSMVSVSAENRESAGVAAGDILEVQLELDTAPRQVEVPSDLSKVLKGDAKRYFEKLSYSNKRRIVLSIEGAKTPETRQRRIDKAVRALREGRTP